ncbi:MAG: TVP38/TMEM64 family protein [Bacteroidota bacterium]
MRDLIKLVFVLALMFASTFLVANLTGMLTIEQIEHWLHLADHFSPAYVALIVVLLLFADLFVAVPTLTISLLAGFFLGFPLGGLSAISGMMMAGLSGYLLSHRYGDVLFKFLIKDPERRTETILTFDNYGFAMILMSRAVPIFPELSACLAGITKMSFSKFILAWSLSSIPYALIAAYAGSVSSIDNPMPAIYTAISMSAALWGGWFIFSRYKKTEPINCRTD